MSRATCALSTVRQPLSSDIDGSSPHAAVQVETHDYKRLEQLCRYITRPTPPEERVQLKAAGQVELKLKTSLRDSTTHLVMSPLEFIQRLVALVPRPRLHLIRFHGTPAPNTKRRALVAPQGSTQPEVASEAATGTACEVEPVQGHQGRIGWACLLRGVFGYDIP